MAVVRSRAGGLVLAGISARERLAVIVTLLLGGRPGRADADGYSGVDRALHRVAFATYEVQADLADIEDRLYASHLGSLTNQRPVFITSLPRAGTTLLLECCAALASSPRTPIATCRS